MRGFMLAGLTAVALIAALGALGTWYFVLRGDEPPPVTMASALDAADAERPGADTSFTASAQQESTDARIEAYTGTWEVDPERSFVGYRVREELVGIGLTTAVGRTSSVEGTLDFDGSSITAVEVTADLRDLKSDDSRRDRQLRRQALRSNTHPEAAFATTESVDVGRIPPDEVAVRKEVTGELTMHGTTRSIEMPIEGQVSGDVLVVVGSVDIALDDYGIQAPSAPLVLSVDDRAVIELQLIFQQR